MIIWKIPDNVKYNPGIGPILYWLLASETRYGKESIILHTKIWSIKFGYLNLKTFITGQTEDFSCQRAFQI